MKPSEVGSPSLPTPRGGGSLDLAGAEPIANTRARWVVAKQQQTRRRRGWSSKDERKYEHIKESSLERGVPEERAKELAARTVNKGRREEGRTPNKRTQGRGNPNRSLEARTVDELQNVAKDLGIEGRSKMRKRELVSAIRDKRS